MSDLALHVAPVQPPTTPRHRRIKMLDAGLVALVMVVVWQAIASWTGGIAISPPLETFFYLAALIQQASFWDHVGATALAFLLSFLLSALFGLGLGLLFGLRRFAGEVAEPVLAGFYTIPKVTLYPVVLLIFGLGMSAKVAFGVMHGLVPVVLLTLGAVRNVSPTLLRTARVLRLPPGKTVRWVLVPACLPDIVNGLRLSFSLSLLGVLIGEMFSSQQGLGFLLVNGMAQHNVPLSTSVVLLIVVFAIAANTAMLRLGRRFTYRKS
jgi:NitT/TauT family transport system permease protein